MMRSLFSNHARESVYPESCRIFCCSVARRLGKPARGVNFGAKLADFEVEGDRPRSSEGSEFLGTFS